MLDFKKRQKYHPGAFMPLLNNRFIAKATVKKERLSLQLNHYDLQKIKAQALEQGIPYQILASSILHKYVSGQLMEKSG